MPASRHHHEVVDVIKGEDVYRDGARTGTVYWAAIWVNTNPVVLPVLTLGGQPPRPPRTPPMPPPRT